MNVLLIEPDQQLAQIYAAALESRGHEVQMAHTAQDAILLADERTPDLVLLEIQLQSHNGFAFIYEFRSYAEWSAIPIKLLTMVPPHAIELTDNIKHELGITAYMYKPTATIKSLLEVVA